MPSLAVHHFAGHDAIVAALGFGGSTTVKSHVRNVLTKLSARDRIHVANLRAAKIRKITVSGDTAIVDPVPIDPSDGPIQMRRVSGDWLVHLVD